MATPKVKGDRVRVGMVGTGFVARLRAEALRGSDRASLVAVAGHNTADTQAFASQYNAVSVDDWKALVDRSDLDLIMVCHINRDHSTVTAAALEANHHVVVEYPLALRADKAQPLLTLAQEKQRLLHVEHIELLGGTHLAAKANLGAIGQPFYTRYCTLASRRPAPAAWTYCPELFGFPLVGALSRLHRLIDCFGPVARVYCQNHYGSLTPGPEGMTCYTTCLCTAQLTFISGLIAEVTYGKGEALWQATRRLEVLGSDGSLCLDGDQGTLTDAQGTRAVEVGSRRGLFAADTAQVIEHLLTGQALYCTPEASLYTLQVATAAQRSAATEGVIEVAAPMPPYSPPSELPR
ncbi:Gfo/Idh/MocA family protein [Phormidium tenue]|uniref:Glycosyl transferase family 2 n=1 Tax=Phormidium tenue NIES-30 TaxID=549789 RepID=A0A1U7JA21_9CYAN|nr:Gfo/Idh/MocA family oxidoreductase [Phormidium tenue]MBD2230606.1 Gfo/Idh/MocA family oxidoreductase [Phormidium tenue FACHB-1052]OKH50628.1 glycosyl transferase family 2 [Phormidium tenue NIES-30]